jgi:hypothetical protein
LLPLFLGAAIIGIYENWAWDDIVYFCIVTTTTIGYGDFVPERQSTKLFAVFFIPVGVGAMGHFLGNMASSIVEQRRRVCNKRLWRHEITVEDLKIMDVDQNGIVSELEFVIFMLHTMKKVD